MKQATLAVIVRHNYVLLGMKHSGEIGVGTWNGPGGKVERNESIVNCVIRETKEELGVILFPQYLQQIATIRFHANNTPDFEVKVFWTDRIVGNPKHTKDMRPRWFHVSALPLSEMLESDRYWFPRAVRKECFTADVYYRERAKHFERIVFGEEGKG
jgi:ADP-ribose pyrophosphatase YjhB (NUDIX family)